MKQQPVDGTSDALVARSVLNQAIVCCTEASVHLLFLLLPLARMGPQFAAEDCMLAP